MSSPEGSGAQQHAPPQLLRADWLSLCRRAAAAQRRILSEVPGIAERTRYAGRGEGGDHSLVIDRRCEDAVLAELSELEAAGHSFRVVSEERGELSLGEGPDEGVVVIDPIDGSLNARRTIPSHSLSIGVSSAGTMADVEFAYVHDFGAEEEFVARAGEGASLNGERIEASGPEHLEVVGLEAAKPELVEPLARALAGRVFRFRAIGSIALSLCYVAAARLDGMVALRPCRSVDAAAGQLIAREAGAEVAFGERALREAGLSLSERYLVAAALREEGLQALQQALGAGATTS